MTDKPEVGAMVTDTWWPWLIGRVVKARKTTITVQWSNGQEWIYDRAHWRYLERA